MKIAVMKSQQPSYLVYLVAAIISILLSCWLVMHDEVINPDGICYIQSAIDFPRTGLHTIMQACGQAKLPFYSILIYGMATLTKLSYIHAAFILNGVFSLISVLVFIYIIRLLGGSIRVMCLAALIILLAHQFNFLREDIIRDHGFWAFYLLSIAMFLQYCQDFRARHAYLWSCTLVMAAMFRIEAVIFLLFVPFSMYLQTSISLKQGMVRFLQLNLLTLLGMLGIFIFTLMHPHEQGSYLSRLSEVQFQITHGASLLSERFTASANALSHSVLSPYSTESPKRILFLFLITWYIYGVIANLTFVYSALIIYAWWTQALRLSPRAKIAIWSYILLNVLITSIFLAENMFMAKRYLIALSLVLMLWVPFALERLLNVYQQRKHILLMIFAAIILSSLGGILNFGYSKSYIRASGQWLAENAPLTAKIYSNDEMILFYSQHFGMDLIKKGQAYNNVDAIADDKWKQFDYVAVRAKKHDPAKNAAILNQITVPAVATFTNSRGDKIVIYKVLNKEILP